MGTLDFFQFSGVIRKKLAKVSEINGLGQNPLRIFDTTNVCKDVLRSYWLKRVFVTDKLQDKRRVSGIENSIVKKDENKLLFQEVVSLPTEYKEVVILYYYQSYITKEFSRFLGIAEGTVRSRLHS